MLSVTLHTVFFFLLLLGGLVNLLQERVEPHEFVLTSPPLLPPRSVEVPPEVDPKEESSEPIEEYYPVEEPEPPPEPISFDESFERHRDPKEESSKPIEEYHPVEEPEPISFDEFLERHGAPKTAELVERKSPRVKIESFNLNLLEEMVREASDATERDESVSKDAAQSELQQYMLRLKQQINRSWNKPKQSSFGGLEATVQFKMDSKGRISDIEIVATSGSTDFDASVVHAVSVVRRNQTLGNAWSLGPTPDGNEHRPRITFRLD